MKPFWMVIRENGPGSEATRVRHITRDSAREEAERLCRATGDTFVVLVPEEYCTPAVFPIEWETIRRNDETDIT